MKKEFKLQGHGYQMEEPPPHGPSVALLNHSGLESDPLYRSLRSDLENYYSESKDPQKALDSAEPKKSIKKALYSNLHSLLSEVGYTNDQSIQKEMLKTVHNWYTKKSPEKNRLPHIHHNNLPSGLIDPPKSLPEVHSSIHKPSTSIPAEPLKKSHYLYKRVQSSDISIQDSAKRSLDIKYLEHRKKDMFSVNESKSRQKVVVSWGSEKARANEDQVRRLEHLGLGGRNFRSDSSEIIREKKKSAFDTNSIRPGSVFDFIKGKTEDARSESNDSSFSLSKISKLRKMHAELIDIEPEGQVRKKHDASMSIYKDIETNEEFFEKFRSKSNEKLNEQIEEVIAVKNKLASKNVSCHVRQLVDGLILTNDPRSLTPALPRGGEYLINNPFLKLGKKKKKKKGKKKGKRKKT